MINYDTNSEVINEAIEDEEELAKKNDNATPDKNVNDNDDDIDYCD